MEYGNFQGIKLLEYELKLFKRVLERKIYNVVEIDPKQFGFMPGKSTVDAIVIVRQLIEKKIKGNMSVFCNFVDLEKAYD